MSKPFENHPTAIVRPTRADEVYVIAVDGPAGAGKGTLCQNLARVIINADVLDTGAIYRAAASRVLAQGIDPADEDACAAVASSLDPRDTRSPDLRTEAVGNVASKISALPKVRRALDDFQRDFARNPPGGSVAILDGRDIGTVIAPDAQLKVYLTASTAVRARRRYDEMVSRGLDANLEEIEASIAERDAREASRAVSPMRPAEDALIIDTDNLTPDEVFDKVFRRMILANEKS